MRRQIRRSSVVALGLFLLILVGGLLVLHWRNAWVAERLASVVTRNLLRERGYTLHLEGIAGRPPGEVTLHRVRISYTGPGHEPFDLFRADRVSLNFSPLSLFRGNFQSDGIELERAELRVFPVRAEGWAYPGFDTAEGRRSDVTVALDAVRVDEFLILREAEAGLDTIRLADADFRLFRNSSGTALDLSGLHLERHGAPALDAAGRFFLREGGMLTLANVELILPESRLDLRGNLFFADSMRVNLDLTAEPGRLREIAAALNTELDTDSYLRGQLHLEGPPDSLRLSGQVSGILYDFELERVEYQGLYQDGRLSFDALSGQLNGSALSGAADFTLPLSGRRFGIEADTDLDQFDLATFLGSGLSTDFTGHLRLDDPGGDMRFHFDLDAGSLDRYSFGGATGTLNLRGDSLIFDTVQAWDEGLSLDLDGLLRPGANSLDLRLTARSDSALLAGHFAGDSTLRGHVDLNGRFTGPIDHPAMDLAGRFTGVRYLDSDWGRGEFTLHSDSLDRSPTAIHVEGNGLERFGLAFDVFFLDARLAGDTLTLRYGSLASERSTIAFGGFVDLASQPLRLELDRVWLRWLGEEWLNDRSFAVDIGDSLALGPAVWHSERGSVSLLWNRPELGPDRILVTELDLEQLAPWLPERLGLSGRLSGELSRDAQGALRCRGRLAEMVLGGVEAGKLTFDLEWQGDSLRVDSLRWALDGERLLRLSGGVGNLPDAAEGLAGLSGLRPDSLVAALTLATRRFPLERLTGLWEESRFLAGDLTSDLIVTGPLATPRVDGDIRLDSCRVGHVLLRELNCTVHQDEDRLHISRLMLLRGDSRLNGWLDLPLALGLGRRTELLPAGQLAGDLHLRLAGEDLLGTHDLLAEVGGEIAGDIRLGGSAAAPEPTGHLRLRNGVLRFSGWEERLETLNLDALVRADTLEVLSLHGREGIKWSRLPKGEMSGAGWLTWFGPFRYQLGLDFTRASFGTLPFFTGQVSGHLDLATWEEAETPPHPYLTGSLLVHEGTLSYSFDEIAESGGATVAPVLSYDLDVRAEQNLMLLNDEANLELSGELHLSNTPTGQDVSGELRTLRGHYIVFGNKFHLIEGYLDFSSAQDINPKIDILAEARNRDDRIQIMITNTFAEPVVDVVSEQGYSREDVLRILVGLPVSGGYEGSRGLAETVVVGRVEAELLNRLERMVSGELAGLVDFGLENRNLDEAGEVETRWQIGRYLPGGLYISYNQGLSMDSDREVGLEYRLYNRLFLRSEIVTRGGQFAEEGLINEYNFDVRLRHEY